MSERRTKYGNRRVEVCGIVFDSRKEANRYLELLAMQQAGEISALEAKPCFVLAPAVKMGGRTKRAMKYTADFAYQQDGKRVVEDVKGGKATATTAYRMRKHLMMSIHGIEVIEV